jgi:hypothetical protein
MKLEAKKENSPQRQGLLLINKIAGGRKSSEIIKGWKFCSKGL